MEYNQFVLTFFSFYRYYEQVYKRVLAERHKYENEMQRIRKMFAQRQNEKKKGPIISFL